MSSLDGAASADGRAALVGAAASAWAKQVVDLGGRNTLLFYKDLKVGTLDLTSSEMIDAEVVEALLDGRTVRLSQLAVRTDLAPLARRARTVRAKARENFEERGLQTLFLAHGMATWKHLRSDATPAAPVLLAPLHLTERGGAAEDFDLQIADDWDVNPTLLHLLEADFGVTVDPDHLLEAGTGGAVFDRLWTIAREVPEFAIASRVVVGNFSYAKQPLALDLQRGVEAMAAHPVVAAIAGDHGATRELLARQPVSSPDDLRALPPDAEYLIVDADASQSAVIEAVRRGANLVVQGPPGTGKSQTIANLIATLTADGQSVLFVAEKRAAIDAVVSRLDRNGLPDLVLDLHGGAASRRTLIAELGRALDTVRAVPRVDVGGLHRRLEASRSKLDTYADALHRVREPFGLSVFDLQARLLELPSPASGSVVLPRATVERIRWDDLDEIEHDLAEWVQLGGPQVGLGAHAWEVGFGRVTSPAHAEHALELTQALAGDAIPLAATRLARLLTECGLGRPATVRDWVDTLRLLHDVGRLAASYDDALFRLDLGSLATALEPAGRSAPGRLVASIFDGDYRRARKAVESVGRGERALSDMLGDVRLAASVRARWDAARIDGGDPRVPPSLSEATDAFAAVTTRLAALATYTGDDGATRDLDDLGARTAALVADRALLRRLPRLHELQRTLEAAGLASVMTEVRNRNLGPDDARSSCRAAWLRSALELISLADPVIASFRGDAHAAEVRTFHDLEHQHIASGAARVRRRVAERANAVMNEQPEQTQLVRQQAARKRGHLPVRDLVQLASHVLVAVKPCWAMSPLVVAQLLPNDSPLFDVVVFDEASQIPPAEAIPAIVRGRTVVVAGDSRQLPPTTFFSSISDTEPVDGDAMRVTDDMESILDAMAALLPPPHGSKSLAWHYRSRDERLIAFSNAQPSLYDWTMTTFPGVLGDDAIRHVHVPWRPDGADQESSADEVAAVVDLVCRHAEQHPDDTLGVITMGIAHAERIAEAIRLRRKSDEVLDAFCAAHPGEPFFVKNLERVQGDERDAIILSIGYGKNADGRMIYRFGPITHVGGERRLNVAVTRARSRMTVVSGFTADDLDDDRLHSEGARMLKRYLRYAASHGTDLGAVARPRPELDPLERDIQQRLSAAGIPLDSRVGASGHWIDVAAAHPEQPDRHILAIETDGAGYHAAPTARDRDRLRQEHLERLGWAFHRIWSCDWFDERDREVQRAVEAWRRAVREQEGTEPAPRLERPRPVPADAGPTDGPRRAAPRPAIVRGQPITAYTDAELDHLIRWLRSDTLLRTDDELLDLAIDELGYARRGKRIVAALGAAIERTRD